MAKVITPLVGASLSKVDSTATFPSGKAPPFAIGSQVLADDGLIYVYAKANASIPASTAVCTINASTFLATASGGSYTSPATALVSGDYAWFSKASV